MLIKIVFPYHMTALALNKEGLKNMFKIVSEATQLISMIISSHSKERLELLSSRIAMGLAVTVQMFLKQL